MHPCIYLTCLSTCRSRSKILYHLSTDSPKELMKKQKRGSSQQSPKRTSQPRRRSSRLSPQNDHKDQSACKVAEEGVLKPRSVNTANWQFTHQAKGFKVPAKNATSKLRRTSSENAKSSKEGPFKPAQVLCPLRHGPKDVCTICMAR